MLVALNFHYVRPEYSHPFPGIHGVTPPQLARQLDLLGTLGRFVTPRDVLEAVTSGTPFDGPSFLVTFDDGLREQFEHALPVLEERGIEALFFANTAPIEGRTLSAVHKIHLVRAHSEPAWCLERFGAAGARSHLESIDPPHLLEAYPYDDEEQARLKFFLNHILSWDERERIVSEVFRERFGAGESRMAEELYMDIGQLTELALRSGLGTHGHRHVPLGHLRSREQGHEVARSMALLEEWTGRRPFALSFPYGTRKACRLADPALLEGNGVAFAFTMERAGNRDLSEPLHLGRFDCNDLPGGRSPLVDAAQMPQGIPERAWTLALEAS